MNRDENNATAAHVPRRRFSRRVKIGAVCVLAVVVVTVAMLPMLAGLLGKGWLEGSASAMIRGSMRFQKVELSWFGPQRIIGVVIHDEQGNALSDLDVTFDHSLLGLIWGRGDIEISVEGQSRTDWRMDGSFSLVEAVLPPGPAPPIDRPLSVTFAPLQLDVLDMQSHAQHRILLDVAEMRYAAGDSLTALIEGGLEGAAAETGGRFVVNVNSDDPFDAAGEFDVAGKGVQASFSLLDFRAVLEDYDLHVERLVLAVSSQDLTQNLGTEIDGAVRVRDLARGESGEDAQRGNEREDDAVAITGRVDWDVPMSAGGELNFDLSRISGSLVAPALPTALLEPFVRGTPIVLARDVGRTVDVHLERDGPTGRLRAEAVGQKAEAHVAAMIADDGSIAQGLLRLDFGLHPDFLEVTAGVRPHNEMRVTVRGENLALPRGETGYRLADASGGVALISEQDAAIQFTHAGHSSWQMWAPPTLSLGAVTFHFESERLGDGLTVGGSFNVDDATVRVDQRIIAGFLDDAGAFALDVDDLFLAGTVAIDNITRELVMKWLPAETADVERMIAAAWAGPLSASVTTGVGDAASAADRTQTADLSVNAAQLSMHASASRDRSALRLTELGGEFAISPEFIAHTLAMLEWHDGPSLLPAGTPDSNRVRFALSAPVDVPGDSWAAYDWMSLVAPLKVDVSHISAVGIPALEPPMSLRDVTIDVRAPLASPMQSSFEVAASLGLEEAGLSLGRLHARVSPVDPAVRNESWLVDARLDDADLAALEVALGWEPDALVQWLGRSGQVALDVEVTPAATAVAGSFDARTDTFTSNGQLQLSDDAISLRAANAGLLLPRARLHALLIDDTPDSGDLLNVAGDAELAADIEELSLPLGLLRGEAIDPKQVRLNSDVKVPRVLLAGRDGRQIHIEDIAAVMNISDLAEGIDYRFGARINVAGGEQAGTANFNGRLRQLLSEANTLDAEQWRLRINGSATAVPTELIDVLCSTDGLMMAALGPHMDINVRSASAGFSPQGGWLEPELSSSAGRVAGRVQGRNGDLYIPRNNPVTAELIPSSELRHRLLHRIHPLLADIRTGEQPIRGRLEAMTIPLDGDLARLNGDARIEVGNVEFDGGSTTLAVMRLFQVRDVRTVPGVIEPIDVRIRDGIVTYERFAVRIDSFSTQFSGRIDLPQQQIDLHWELPLTAIAELAPELRPIVENISVPLRTAGTFDNYRTGPAPDFNLQETLLRAGLRGGLEQILRGREDVPFGNLLDLLRRVDEEKNGSDPIISPIPIPGVTDILDRILRDRDRNRGGE